MTQIAEIIQYEGDNLTFVWKHPLEDFNSLTQLIVHESQEAIFFMNGQALDLFGAGRYTLETQNIPKIGRFLRRNTGDQTPFHCEVYFVNKTEQMAIKWGTPSKIEYIDPLYGFPLTIGLSGDMSLRVNDSRKLLVKIVGTENHLGQLRLIEYFRGILLRKIKSHVASTIKLNKISIFELDENLDAFSEQIHKLLYKDFEDYGVALERFNIFNVMKPIGEEQYEKFRDLHFRQYTEVAEETLKGRLSVIQAEAEAQKIIIESKALATKRAQEGYTYINERAYGVMDRIAENEGSGSDLRNAAMGVGMGFGVGGAFGNALESISRSTMGGLMEATPEVINDSVQIPGMIQLKEEPEQGVSSLNTNEDDLKSFENKVKRLKAMLDSGLLTEEEYREHKQKLLNEIYGR